jgi:DNA-directed RNA polymerase specialized sigma24 family protein
MDLDHSISHWLKLLQNGDTTAAQPLWDRYFHRLVGLARTKLQGKKGRATDEEDVALSAFASFYRAAEAGRFPKLNDRDDLWRLLVTVTERKALNLVRDENRQKRGGGAVRQESDLPTTDDSTAGFLDALAGKEPTPEFAVQIAEEFRMLLEKLEDAELQKIAVWRMEGLTTAEIATSLGCALTTVERRLRLIRRIWAEEDAA